MTISRDLGETNVSDTQPDVSDRRLPRREAIRRKNEELASAKVEAPRGIFETIVIDPPWPMTKIEREVRHAQRHSALIWVL
jgi:hypothetical protein